MLHGVNCMESPVQRQRFRDEDEAAAAVFEVGKFQASSRVS